MSFTTPRGSRGGTPPRGPFVRFFNRIVSWRTRRSGRQSFMGMDVLVLHTVGRRSGEPRQTPLAWFPGPDGTRLVVASAGGSADHPAWYYNVAAHPDQVEVEIGGVRTPVTADELHGEERAAAWTQIVATTAQFGRYEQRTDREIPVVRLTAR